MNEREKKKRRNDNQSIPIEKSISQHIEHRGLKNQTHFPIASMIRMFFSMFYKCKYKCIHNRGMELVVRVWYRTYTALIFLQL